METGMKQAIDPKRWYKPSEIAENRFIVNSVNKADVYFVLKLIRRGKLEADNYATENKPFYRVSGSEIIRYKKENEGYVHESDSSVSAE